MTGYASNQFYNAGSYMDPSELDPDANSNPEFKWPGKTRKHSEPFNENGTWVDKGDVRRGFIRMLTMTKGGTATDTMKKRRCFFQFNPDKITRSVSMREDMMHPLLQSPTEFTLPVPGNANFGFTLMFDRSFELNNAKNTSIPPTDPEYGRGIDNPNGNLFIPDGDYLLTASPEKVGVLTDIRILDGIVGQGISEDMIAYILERGEIYQSYKAVQEISGEGETVSEGEQVLAWSDLMTGASGATVTKVQQALVANDSTLTTTYPNFVDGHYGKNTTQAVKDYQTAKGIQSTGIVDEETAESLGVENTEPVSTTTTTPVTSDWNPDQARNFLDKNLGNQAFLIPNPVRVVFSSLFMVDGFVTSMTVSHVRFNENMVPMTCYVDVQMQAVYIGFARKDTFLTEALEQAEALQTTPSADTPITDTIKDSTAYAATKDFIFSQKALKDFKLVVQAACKDDDWDDDGLWGAELMGNPFGGGAGSDEYPYVASDDILCLTTDGYVNGSEDMNLTNRDHTHDKFKAFLPGLFGQDVVKFKSGFKQPEDIEDDLIYKALAGAEGANVSLKRIEWTWDLRVTRGPFSGEIQPQNTTVLFEATSSSIVSVSSEWDPLRRVENVPITNTAFPGDAKIGRTLQVRGPSGSFDTGTWKTNAVAWLEGKTPFKCVVTLRGSVLDSKDNKVHFFGRVEWNQGVGNTIKISVPIVEKEPAISPRPGRTPTPLR